MPDDYLLGGLTGKILDSKKTDGSMQITQLDIKDLFLVNDESGKVHTECSVTLRKNSDSPFIVRKEPHIPVSHLQRTERRRTTSDCCLSNCNIKFLSRIITATHLS